MFSSNLLLPTGSEQQPANYIVTVYGAYGLSSANHGESDNRRYNKAPDSFVKVSFCGLSVYAFWYCHIRKEMVLIST